MSSKEEQEPSQVHPLGVGSATTTRRIAQVQRCLVSGAPAGSTGGAGAVRARVSAAEWEQRVLLAAAYRKSALLGWDEHIYNHITAAVPRADGSASGTFLLNPFGLRFCEVTASSLVTVDLEGAVQEAGSSGRPINLAGFVIHSAVHAARHDLRCLFHNHSDACTAVATQRRGLLPLSQEACIIWPQVSRSIHPFEGVATDASERARLLEALGPAPSAVLFLRNHGVLVGGSSVGAAFWNTFLVWRACQLQCSTMATVGGRFEELEMPPQYVVEGTGKRVQAGLDAAGATWGSLEFEAVLRQMRDEQPDFER